MEENSLVRRTHLRDADADLRVGFGWTELDPVEQIEYDDLVQTWVVPWASSCSRGKGAKRKLEGERRMLRTDIPLLPSGPV
jgi:hypothetical protein